MERFLDGSCREVFAIVARRGAQHPDEGAAHLFLVAEPSGLGDGRYALGGFFQPSPRGVNADRFDRFGRRAPAHLRVDPREVARTHVHAFRERLDPKVFRQVLGDPEL
jgi:hypothetical protein